MYNWPPHTISPSCHLFLIRSVTSMPVKSPIMDCHLRLKWSLNEPWEASHQGRGLLWKLFGYWLETHTMLWHSDSIGSFTQKGFKNWAFARCSFQIPRRDRQVKCLNIVGYHGINSTSFIIPTRCWCTSRQFTLKTTKNRRTSILM